MSLFNSEVSDLTKENWVNNIVLFSPNKQIYMDEEWPEQFL